MMGITACTAASALGVGAAAHRQALMDGIGALRPNDFEPGTGGWIGRVDAIETHTLPAALRHHDCRNNRLADLALRADGFDHAVAAAVRRHGADRVALVLGTSTSGVNAAEDAYRGRRGDGPLPAGFDYDHTQDLYSVAGYVRAALGLRGPSFVVSTACASSARCFVDGARLVRAGVCDAVVVGGADSLCRMTLHGFAALELLSGAPCRPCAADRAGISIGEAAGFALLECHEGGMMLLGGGCSSDGHHMSTPHPEGAGAVAAMQQALMQAGLAADEIGWINLHGTGTQANDAMEDMAVHAVFGADVPVSSTKGWTGHTLGACGILEALIARECMDAGLVPGCLGIDGPDPSFRAQVVVAPRRQALRRVMSNSFGFGGVNCSLVFGAAA